MTGSRDMERLTDEELTATLFTAKCGAAGTNDGELKGSYARCVVAALTELLRYREAAMADVSDDVVRAFEESYLAALYPDRRDFVLSRPGTAHFEAYRTALASVAEAARAGERERCAGIAQGFMPDGPDPIGPLHGAGRAFSARHIASAIRGKTEGDK